MSEEPRKGESSEADAGECAAGTAGIANFSNTCFTSAVLQVLNHCGPLVALFDSMVLNLGQFQGEHFYEQSERRQHAKMLIKQYFLLQRELWRKKTAVESAALLRTMQSYNPMFDGTTQQDTHEFLNALLDYLHEGLLYYVPESLEPMYRTRKRKHQPSEGSSKEARPRRYRRSAISETFEGSLCTTIVCTTCGHQSHTLEHFYDLSLPIPSKKQQAEEAERIEIARRKLAQATQPNTPTSPAEEMASPVHRGVHVQLPAERTSDASDRPTRPAHKLCSFSLSALSGVFGSVSDLLGWNTPALPLSDCLESFFAPEPLSDQYQCDHCKTASEAVKMVGIARYPQILVLHMKRFRSVGMWHSKLHTHVHFPDQQLDMLPYFVETQQYVPAGHASYDLFGVIQHHGGMNGGHYVAYVRHLLTDEWYEYDDTHVRRVSFDLVKSREAYLLFYSMRPVEADTEQLKDTLLKYVKRATATPKPSLQAASARRGRGGSTDGELAHSPPLPPPAPFSQSSSPSSSDEERHRAKKPKREVSDQAVEPVDGHSAPASEHDLDEAETIYISRQWAFRMLHDSRIDSPCNHDVACPHGRIKPHLGNLGSSAESLLLPIRASDYFDTVSRAFGEKDRDWIVAHEHAEEELAVRGTEVHVVRFVQTRALCEQCSVTLKQRCLQRMTERQMVTSVTRGNGNMFAHDDEDREADGEPPAVDEEEEDEVEEHDDEQRPEADGSEGEEGSDAEGGEAAATTMPLPPRKVCLIHRPWMQAWWRYCSIDYLEDIDRLVERPGPVSNERLFDREGNLLPKLELDVHYSAVAPEVYEAFVQLYSGGPEIVRSSFDIYSDGPAADRDDEEDEEQQEQEEMSVQATV